MAGLIASRAAAAADRKPEEFKDLFSLFSRQSVTSEVQGYVKATNEGTQSNLLQVMTSCTKGEGVDVWPRIIFILALDRSGTVREARGDSDLPLARCVETAWIGKQYKAPPMAPFYRMVVLKARGPKAAKPHDGDAAAH